MTSQPIKQLSSSGVVGYDIIASDECRCARHRRPNISLGRIGQERGGFQRITALICGPREYDLVTRADDLEPRRLEFKRADVAAIASDRVRSVWQVNGPQPTSG